MFCLASIVMSHVQLLLYDFLYPSISTEIFSFCFALSQSLCTNVNLITSVLKGGDSTTTTPVIFFQKPFANTATPSRNSLTEYYFADSYTLTINDTSSITSTGDVLDYCPLRHPLNRTQRYFTACSSSSGCISNRYQTYRGCSFRDNFAYNGIPATFFTSRSPYVDDGTNFVDFDNSSRGARMLLHHFLA